jgi:hypothetical protein
MNSGEQIFPSNGSQVGSEVDKGCWAGCFRFIALTIELAMSIRVPRVDLVGDGLRFPTASNLQIMGMGAS